MTRPGDCSTHDNNNNNNNGRVVRRRLTPCERSNTYRSQHWQASIEHHADSVGLQLVTMASELNEVMQRLSLADTVSCIDDILFQQAPRKRQKWDPSKLKTELENKYLSPSTTFSTEWLNRLQPCVFFRTDSTSVVLC